jgi:hypothetical protein
MREKSTHRSTISKRKSSLLNEGKTNTKPQFIGRLGQLQIKKNDEYSLTKQIIPLIIRSIGQAIHHQELSIN